MADRPPVRRLREAIEYDPASGILTWKARPLSHFCNRRAWKVCNTVFTGRKIGRASGKGYLIFQMSVGEETFKLTTHRVAWALYYGSWPKQHIDHINGDRKDNRISNLRDVPNCENARNQRLHVTNTSGHAGVTFHKKSGKWLAQIIYQGQHHYLGVFHNLEDAVTARKAAADAFGFHPNHGRNHAK